MDKLVDLVLEIVLGPLEITANQSISIAIDQHEQGSPKSVNKHKAQCEQGCNNTLMLHP
jgi:hypothetical protein